MTRTLKWTRTFLVAEQISAQGVDWREYSIYIFTLNYWIPDNPGTESSDFAESVSSVPILLHRIENSLRNIMISLQLSGLNARTPRHFTQFFGRPKWWSESECIHQCTQICKHWMIVAASPKCQPWVVADPATEQANVSLLFNYSSRFAWFLHPEPASCIVGLVCGSDRA